MNREHVLEGLNDGVFRRLRGQSAGVVLWALAAVFLVGCGESSRVPALTEADERHFQRGQQMLRENRKDEALAAFLRVIDSRRDAPESHLEAGRLYQEHIGDPIAAIYHFRKYIEARPGTNQTPIVRQMIESAQKDFVRTLPGQPFKDQIDRLDLLEIIGELRDENAALKTQVAELRRSAGQTAVAVAPAARPPATTQQAQPRPVSPPRTDAPAATVRTYVVQEGDTLSRVSANVYGTSARWADIYQANRDILPNPNSLRVGQELRIP